MLEDFAALQKIYGGGFDVIYHFAAQAGVRYSLDNPRAYVDANLNGTFNLLELMRHAPPSHALHGVDILRLWGQCEDSV